MVCPGCGAEGNGDDVLANDQKWCPTPVDDCAVISFRADHAPAVVPDVVSAMTPSAEAVYRALRTSDGEATVGDVADEAGVAYPTASAHLGTFVDKGVADRRFSLTDARRMLYRTVDL